MLRIHSSSKWRSLLFACVLLFCLMFAACGASTSNSSAGTMNQASSSAGNSSSSVSQSSSQHSAQSTSKNSGDAGQQQSADSPAQYLIKSLEVDMNVKDTTRVADELQNWISATDPRSTSAGINFQQMGNNQYSAMMKFAVQASQYPQIERYLRDYPAQHGGQLTGFSETVQDVTNDYIDTSSRLQNLRGEQTRLQDLLSHATALGDIISIEDKLTNVEGQIENIEAHLKALKDQVTYYIVTINLQPLAVTTTSQQPSGWSIGQTFHDAFAASLSLAQGLLSLAIWLLAFSFYLVPLALAAWLVVRYRRHVQRVMPKASPVVPPPAME